jgi:hypothetical protein
VSHENWIPIKTHRLATHDFTLKNGIISFTKRGEETLTLGRHDQKLSIYAHPKNSAIGFDVNGDAQVVRKSVSAKSGASYAVTATTLRQHDHIKDGPYVLTRVEKHENLPFDFIAHYIGENDEQPLTFKVEGTGTVVPGGATVIPPSLEA